MEIRSPAFRDAVNEALDSDVMVLGTIFVRPLPFTGAVRKRPDVTIFEVRSDNRAKLVSELAAKFRNLNTACGDAAG